MPPISSKDFKKRYAVSARSVTGKGVWSGRGIGIPIAGAVDGSADGSRYLGRPRKPFSKYQLGSPSQSADSGFASYMARVNKGWDGEYESLPMFPEQETEEEDIYSYEDIDPVINRKIPRSFKLAAKSRIREADILGDGIFIENSRYSISTLFEDLSDEVEVADDSDVIDVAVLGAKSLAKSTVLAVPFVDAFLGTIIAAVNVGQIASGTQDLARELGVSTFDFGVSLSSLDDRQWSEIVDRACRLPEDRRPIAQDIMLQILSDIKTLILTVVQSYDSIVALAAGPFSPAVMFDFNLKTFATGLLSEIIPFEVWLFKMTAGGSSMFDSLLDGLRSIPGGEFLIDRITEPAGPLATAIFKAPALSFQRTLDLYNAIVRCETQPEVELEDEPEVELEDELETILTQNFPEEDMDKLLDQDIDTTLDRYTTMATVPVRPEHQHPGLFELKQFILHEIALYGKPQPEGYVYREVPMVVEKEVDTFEILDDYDDLSVVYKTDGGVIAYQHRNKLKEIALRRIIREIATESKKKR